MVWSTVMPSFLMIDLIQGPYDCCVSFALLYLRAHGFVKWAERCRC